MFFLMPLELKHAGPRTPPTANAALVAINVLVYFFGLSAALAVGPGSAWFTVVGYGFAHAGAWHLLANMWLLLVFGNPVNRRLGNAWYLLVYLGTIFMMGLWARLWIHGVLLGASGAIFAVVIVALMLMPAARIDVGYVALFPITVLISLLRRPAHWLDWFVRWGRFCPRAVWGLLLVPLVELWSLIWAGWNWTNLAHLAGMLCGLGFVLVLPPRISMPRRVAADATF